MPSTNICPQLPHALNYCLPVVFLSVSTIICPSQILFACLNYCLHVATTVCLPQLLFALLPTTVTVCLFQLTLSASTTVGLIIVCLSQLLCALNYCVPVTTHTCTSGGDWATYRPENGNVNSFIGGTLCSKGGQAGCCDAPSDGGIQMGASRNHLDGQGLNMRCFNLVAHVPVW